MYTVSCEHAVCRGNMPMKHELGGRRDQIATRVRQQPSPKENAAEVRVGRSIRESHNRRRVPILLPEPGGGATLPSAVPIAAVSCVAPLANRHFGEA